LRVKHIVTGATRGIGRAIASNSHVAGPTSLSLSKSAEAAEEVKTEIERLGTRALSFQCDVANTESVAEMVKQVKDRFGRIDYLVNMPASRATI